MDSLLYVGIARNPLSRLATHSTAEWAPDVTQVRIAWYRTRTAAFDAAALAIAQEHPYYNMQTLHPPRSSGQLIGAAAAVYRLSCNPAPLCESCESKVARSAIYLGVAGSPLSDMHRHHRKGWAGRVTHVGIEYYRSRREALEAEALVRKQDKAL